MKGLGLNVGFLLVASGFGIERGFASWGTWAP